MKKLIDELGTEHAEQIEKAFEDALLWGAGFIKVTADGRIARVSAEHVDKYLEYLNEHGKKLLGGKRG